MLKIIAFDNENNKTGTINERATINLEMKVHNVEFQTDFELPFFDSSETWIPNASERESAIAIIIIPPRTIPWEFVLELSPMIKPKVVIIPDVNPNPTPLSVELLIHKFKIWLLKKISKA